MFLYLVFIPFLIAAQLGSQIISDSYKPSAYVPAANIDYVQKISGQPSQLIVDRLGISLPIDEGIYDVENDSWNLSNGTVYFANMTSLPNNKNGSTFLYGHNQDDTLAKLGDLAVGDKILIETENNHKFTYRYEKDEYIMPDQTSILYEKPAKPRVVIAICESLFGITRRIMYFNLVEVN